MQDQLRATAQNGLKSLLDWRRVIHSLMLACALLAMACSAIAQAPACLLGTSEVGSLNETFPLRPYATTVTASTMSAGIVKQVLSPATTVTVNNVGGIARTTAPVTQRWRLSGTGSYTLTLNFSVPVPADQLILIFEDIGFATPGPYNPSATLTVTGAGADPASPADFYGTNYSSNVAGPVAVMQYTPATGVARKTIADTSREQLALVGGSGRTLSRLQVSWTGLNSGDSIAMYLFSVTSCLTTQKNTLGAGGSFGFANSGLLGATSAVTTGGSGQSAQSMGFITRPGTALAVTENVPPGWQFTGASCVDAYAPANGNPTTPLGTQTGSRMDIAAVNNRPNANLLCTFRNSWVLAQNDSAATPASTALAGTSVLANDAGASLAITALNGSACGGFPCVRALPLGNLSMNADGSYVFAPTAGLAGTVTVPYSVADPENATGTASLSIRVDPTLTANPVTGTATAGTNSTPIPNVAGNSTVNGVPATLGPGGNAVVTTVGTWPPGITLDPNTGAVTATAGLPPSVAYVLDYQLCDRSGPPAVCKTSQATVLLLPLADMGVTLQAPTTRLPDVPVQASFTCTNHGPSAAVGASCSMAPISGASVSCTPAAIPNPLPVGGTIACSVVIPASAFGSGTPLVLQATASSSTPDHVPANNTAQAQLPASPTAIPVGGPMLPLMGIALAVLAGWRLRRRR